VSWNRKSIAKTESLRNRLPAGLSHIPLFTIGLLLTAFGLLMIYSSSAVMGLQKYGDALYFVKRHALFMLIGWGLYFAAAQIPFAKLERYRLVFLVASLVLLLSVFLPGIGLWRGGAQRWVSLGIMQFQPSELVKLLLIFYLAATLTVRAKRLDSFNQGFLPLLIVTGGFMLLLLLQPDFGGAMSVFLLSICMWFVGGVPLAFLSGMFILSLPGIALVVMNAGYRMQRVLTFLDPWSDPHGSGFQVIQSFMAFHQGCWAGVGIGNSQQKLYYLPEAHTDFIFSVIGEELGVIGVVLVVLLFLSLLVFGARIASKQASKFGYYLGAGMTCFLLLPALLNMMVTMGLLPTKGLTLPFFSSGGSSLLVSLMALGVLQGLNHRKEARPQYEYK
jgi:cell division protein FtsW